VVDEIVNCISSRILTSRLFAEFLEEFRANESEMLYHMEVPLSSSASASAFCRIQGRNTSVLRK
jgi:hypothetical protein